MDQTESSRRQFLTTLLAAMLAPSALGSGHAWGALTPRAAKYVADVGMLYGALTFRVGGTLTERIDRTAGRYTVTLAGEGSGVTQRTESIGVLRQGRWSPLESHSEFEVKGRHSRGDIVYDWTRRTIDYRFRGETFFLRRLRVVHDVVPVPPGMHVDDTISAVLNFADGAWAAEADGTLQTHVVRRKKPDDEGPDEVRGAYRAELVPLTLSVASDPASGKAMATFDLSRFSSWAKRDEPGRITFRHDKRPELIALDMILGTTVRIAITG
jgi:hypothetical protein